MATEPSSLFPTVRRILRFAAIASFPAALVLSVPYPFHFFHRYYYRENGYQQASIAPAVGVIILFFAALSAFGDLGYWKRLKGRWEPEKYEYRILLNSGSEDVKKGEMQKIRLTIFADIFFVTGIAIVLSFALRDLEFAEPVILTVYASLPYFISGTSHVVLALLGLFNLAWQMLRLNQCPRCHYVIGNDSTAVSPQEHPPNMTSVVEGEADLVG